MSSDKIPQVVISFYLSPHSLTTFEAQLFAESVERHFGIQSGNFDSKYFDKINQFIEENYEYFYPPEEPDDYRSDIDDDHDLVADVDSDTPIRIVLYSHRNCLSRCQTD